MTTQKEKLARARAIIDRNVYGVPFSAADTKDFNAVLGTPHTVFVRERLAKYPGNARHVIADGVALSWRQCISPQSSMQWCAKAMRESVWQPLDSYLHSQPPVSVECLATDDLTTDHKDPSFARIAEAFMSEQGPPELEKTEAGGRIADPAVATAWRTFHALAANYQVLCRSCNAAKGAR